MRDATVFSLYLEIQTGHCIRTLGELSIIRCALLVMPMIVMLGIMKVMMIMIMIMAMMMIVITAMMMIIKK